MEICFKSTAYHPESSTLQPMLAKNARGQMSLRHSWRCPALDCPCTESTPFHFRWPYLPTYLEITSTFMGTLTAISKPQKKDCSSPELVATDGIHFQCGRCSIRSALRNQKNHISSATAFTGALPLRFQHSLPHGFEAILHTPQPSRLLHFPDGPTQSLQPARSTNRG